MLSQESLDVRKNLYACCAGKKALLASQQKDYGMSCYKETEDRMAFLLYMVSLLCGMPENPTCITDEELCELIEEADRCCVDCAPKCPPTAPPPVDCTIVPFAEVISAIPQPSLPPEPEEGDSYYILEGENAGRVATWQGGAIPQWVYTQVDTGSAILDSSGTYWTNTGNGPGPLFPSGTFTLIGPNTWQVQSDFPGIDLGRTVRILASTPLVPGPYVVWEGPEADLPATVVVLTGFDELTFQYTYADGCFYISSVAQTIPDPSDACGSIRVEVDDIVSGDGVFFVPITLFNNLGYPLGPLSIVIDGGDPENGVVPVMGPNEIGPFLLGQTVVITITNSNDPFCNISLDAIATPCPAPSTFAEVVNECNSQPEGPTGPTVSLWGSLVTVEWTPDFPAGGVFYETPLTPGPVACTPLGGGQYACGPLDNVIDPGPMNVTVESGVNKNCVVNLGPFEPLVFAVAQEVEYAVDFNDAFNCYNTSRSFIISDTLGFGIVPRGSIFQNGSVQVPASELGIYDVIYASENDEYWINTPEGPGLRNPTLSLSHVEGSTEFQVTSRYPFIHQYFGREFELEGNDGTGWQAIPTGGEDILDSPLTFDLGVNFLGFRYRYTGGNVCNAPEDWLYLDIPVAIVNAPSVLNSAERTVFRSYNYGPWVEVRSGIVSGGAGPRIAQVAVNPENTDIVLQVGSDSGTFAVSVDRGVNWAAPGGSWSSLGAINMQSISFGKEGPSVWIGAIGKILRSTDGGATFDAVTAVTTSTSYFTGLHIMCAIDDLRALCGTSTGLWYTEDGGATWDPAVNTSGRDWSFASFAYNKIIHLGGGRIIASSGRVSGVANSYVLISNDYGKTYTEWRTTGPIAGQQNEALIFYSESDDAFVLGRLYWNTKDAGDSWTQPSTCNSLGGFAAFGINPRTYIGINKFQEGREGGPNGVSLNGGITWFPLGEYFPTAPAGVDNQATGCWAWALLPREQYNP